MLEIEIQLHGGGGGGSSAPPVKTSAPGSTAAATIDGSTEGERQSLREKLSRAKGKRYTDKTGGGSGSMVDSLKKALLGE